LTDSRPDSRFIQVEARLAGHPGVALVTIDRPDARNALTFALLAELADTLETLDRDGDVRAIVLTGAGERAFAAGADIVELAEQTPERLAAEGHFEAWDRISAIGLPVIAAVRGYALGGGCELAMSCDLIVAGDDAQFGQPEIRIGVMPGAGGTQRLTRAIGQARAMEMILTGRMLPAEEALAAGLVSRVVPAGDTLDSAVELADSIAGMPPVAVRAAKAAVRSAAELPLSEGLRRERAAFFALFDTTDQREGMAAFMAKRSPSWTGR
jgi:enoyl-CoA hydratase